LVGNERHGFRLGAKMGWKGGVWVDVDIDVDIGMAL
jgi:hypothetical protein